GLIGRTDAADLDQMIHHREPAKAMALSPLRLRLHRLERFGGVGPIDPGRVVDAKLHQNDPVLARDGQGADKAPPRPMSQRLTSYAVLIQTAFTFRYSSICWMPDSRP